MPHHDTAPERMEFTMIDLSPTFSRRGPRDSFWSTFACVVDESFDEFDRDDVAPYARRRDERDEDDRP